MRKFITGLATLTALAVGLPMVGSRAEAAAIPATGGLRAAIDTFALTETVQLLCLGGPPVLLVRRRLAGPGLVLVRLCMASRIWLGRRIWLAWLGRRTAATAAADTAATAAADTAATSTADTAATAAVAEVGATSAEVAVAASTTAAEVAAAVRATGAGRGGGGKGGGGGGGGKGGGGGGGGKGAAAVAEERAAAEISDALLIVTSAVQC